MKVWVLAALACARTEAAGVTCSGGRKNVANPANTNCKYNDCPNTCCIVDPDKCLSWTLTGTACNNAATKTYKSDGGVTKGATPADACCQDKATCNDHSCPSGSGKKNNPGNIRCAGLAATCTDTQCCDNTAGQCRAWFAGGNNCAANTYPNPSKMGSVGASSNDCCIAKATCNDAKCSNNNMDKNAANKDNRCPTNADSCPLATCCTVTADTLCRNVAAAGLLNCGADKIFDPRKGDAKSGTTADNKKANCCIADDNIKCNAYEVRVLPKTVGTAGGTVQYSSGMAFLLAALALLRLQE